MILEELCCFIVAWFSEYGGLVVSQVLRGLQVFLVLQLYLHRSTFVHILHMLWMVSGVPCEMLLQWCQLMTFFLEF